MDIVEYWMREIGAAKKREKNFRKEGERILSIYGGRKIKDTPFNILYSNTETLLPAIYSQVPIPVVQRRFKDEDQIGKQASEASIRVLKFLLDTNVEGYETFDEAMGAAVLDGLLPGRGITTVKYDAEINEAAPGPMDDDGNPLEEGAEKPETPENDTEVGEEETGDIENVPYKGAELVCCETRQWNKVFFGYARKWSKVPWICFEEHIDKEEAERLFGEELASQLTFTANEQQHQTETEGTDYEADETMDEGAKKTTCVYQIWDKTTRKVCYVSEQYKDGYLKELDDPMQLTGFFNMPKPIMFLAKNDLIPVALYELYETQAKELNNMTRRINLLIDAIKARGVYDGSLGDDIKRMLDADDNELVAADTASSLAVEKGFQNAIWMWPVEQLITVLRELLNARESCKATIYEITGISDILRGSTVASETATAQKIKSQWGSLRLKRLQKEVQRYSRDLLRMMLEVAATKFSEETWAKMTGLPFNTSETQSQLMQIAQIAQMTGQPLDPKTQAQLQMPAWGDVLKLLQDDMQRAFRIDIETNSTVEAEATDDKEQMAEAMNALGQALNGLTPLVVNGSLPFQAAQAMLLVIVRRFRFGTEIEDMIKAMTPPQQGDPNAAKQMQAQLQQLQQQLQAAGQQNQEQKMALDHAGNQVDLIKREAALQVDQIRLEEERKVFALEKKYTEQMIAAKVDTAQTKLGYDQKTANLQNQKFKTENVVNQKADTRLGESAKAMEGIVMQMAEMQKQLMQVVVQNSEASDQRVQMMVQAVTAPRIKKAIRGKDGRIEAVEEATQG